MRQRVTMGYFMPDTTGIRRPVREDVIVEDDGKGGDYAAAVALAQHGTRLATLSGYGPDGQPRIGIMGIEPAGNEPAPEPAMQGGEWPSDSVQEPELTEQRSLNAAAQVLPPATVQGPVGLPVISGKRGPGRPPKVAVNAV